MSAFRSVLVGKAEAIFIRNSRVHSHSPNYKVGGVHDVPARMVDRLGGRPASTSTVSNSADLPAHGAITRTVGGRLAVRGGSRPQAARPYGKIGILTIDSQLLHV
jgi:hypothetical protein